MKTVPIAPQSDGTSIDGKLIAKDVTIANLKVSLHPLQRPSVSNVCLGVLLLSCISLLQEDILQLKSEVAKLVEENHVLTAVSSIYVHKGNW